MKKQCIVVGLGRYGMNIVKRLVNEDVEVLVVDTEISKIEKVSAVVSKAVCIDVTSEEAWNELPVKEMDFAIVCYGKKLEESIMSCMILKGLGIDYIIAKAGSKIHKDILEKLEVDEVVFPEEYVANMTVDRIIKKIE